MKKILYALLFVIVFGSVSAQKGQTSGTNPMVVTDHIVYGCAITDLITNDFGKPIEYDTASMKQFLQSVFDFVRKEDASGVYENDPKSSEHIYYIDPENPDYEWDPSQLNEFETVTLVRPEPPYDTYDVTFARSLNISMFRFSEQWIVDIANINFTKILYGYCPVSEVVSEDNELRGYRPLFWMWHNELPSPTGKDIVIASNATYDVMIRSYMIDPAGGEGAYYMLDYGYMHNNIEASHRNEFLSTIFRKMYFGEINAYDKHGKTLSKEQFHSLITETITEEFTLMQDFPPYDTYDTTIVTVNFLPLEEFTCLRFVEEWTYNPVSLILKKKVKAIGFIHYPNDSKFYGTMPKDPEPLFWLFFNQK
jgi:hypothetical protein